MSFGFKFLLFVYVNCLILIFVSECVERDNESCRNIAALKGLVHMVESVSSSLKDIVSSAKFRADSLEENMCIGPRIRSGNSSRLSNGHDHCVRAEPDCKSLFYLGFRDSGPYRIWPTFLNHSIIVYCDMTTDGGGWLVIQRRGDFDEEPVDFYRTWAEYKNGFGDVNKEFWLGNDIIFALTNAGKTTLRVDLEDFSEEHRFAKYKNFLVRSELEKYKMTIGEYKGNAGDSLRTHNGSDFHTKDFGNSCPKEFKGGWWYNQCHEANLNGLYLGGNHSSYADGVNWLHFKGFHYSLAKSEMKIKLCDC